MFSDKTSDHYVEDPVFDAVVGGTIGFVVAYAFMIVFDVVSDTILYCFVVERKRRLNNDLDPNEQYAPSTLHSLIEDVQHGECDE